MAIVQISRIQQRQGLTENLPQLAGGELGWAVDSRRLFIGNGTLANGAPAIGNTEVLTEYSDILDLASSYTYKGAAAGYIVETGPSASDPVTRTLQAVLDDYASVKDFGATGDGVTDDTAAVNRALYQLYCIDINPQIRRSLFFPAGVYRITSSLLIPPFARLIGEGANSSIIALDQDTLDEYVARTTDSLQQTGTNIGNNGAVLPQYVEVSDMAFTTAGATNIFLYEYVNHVRMENCDFYGPYSAADVAASPPAEVSCVRFSSASGSVVNHITFDNCVFSNMPYAVTANEAIQGIVFTNSNFESLYQGVLLGTGTVISGGPAGVRLTQNTFDLVSAEAIVFGNVQKNVSGYNIFLDVGNRQQGSGNPATPNISIQNDNNVSIGDMFARNDVDNSIHPRIFINLTSATSVFALDNGERYKFGSYQREAGGYEFLTNTAVPVEIFRVSVAEVNGAFAMEYRYQDANTLLTRYGRMTVVGVISGQGTLSYNDDFVRNAPWPYELTLTPSMDGDYIVMSYVAAASQGYFTWSLSHF